MGEDCGISKSTADAGIAAGAGDASCVGENCGLTKLIAGTGSVACADVGGKS